MENIWAIAAIWVGLALVASLLSIRFKMSVALLEIIVGVVAGNFALLLEHYHLFGLHWELKTNPWIAFLAGFGAILLTFMAGAEIEPAVMRQFFKESMAIGLAGFRGRFWCHALCPVCERMDGTRRDLRDCHLHHVCGRGLRGHGRTG